MSESITENKHDLGHHEASTAATDAGGNELSLPVGENKIRPDPESQDESQNGAQTRNGNEFQCGVESQLEEECKPENVSMTSVKDDGSHKNKRPRIKALLYKLQTQVEFYFSDANISKDRFLKQKISEDPDGYVPIELIASFNKMKALTTDESMVLQAIEKSSLLQVSPDHKCVRRSTPLPSLSEADINSRTIYVENLPNVINHDKLRNVFKSFGIVTYISLPRHKTSNAPKGFAFIEFSSTEEAQKAVQFFKKEETEETHPKKPEDTSNESSATQLEDNVFTSNVETSDQSHVEACKETGNAKRARDDTEDELTTSESLCKKFKSESEAGGSMLDTSSELGVTNEQPLPQTVMRIDSEISTLDDEEGEVTEKKKKKLRKHRKRKESLPQHLKESNLRVLTKNEWLEMKVIFKQMQKEQMKKIKAENKKSKESDVSKSEQKGFIANCLVKFSRTEVDKQSDITSETLKDLCSKYGPVAYVDYKPTDTEGYVRFGGSGCVDKLLDDGNIMEGLSFESMKEEDERAYYLKTLAARRQRFSNRKRKTTRGQDRVISKALKESTEKPKCPKPTSTHIHFTDSD